MLNKSLSNACLSNARGERFLFHMIYAGSDALKSAARESSLAYGLVRWGAFGKRPRGQHVEHVREMVLSTPMTTMALAAKSLFDFHYDSVSYTHLRAHETRHDLVCRLLLEKKKK